MRLVIAIIILVALAGVPGAHAMCMKDDCSQDPQAWADAFGTSLQQRAEQSRARSAAMSVIQAERDANSAELLADLGINERLHLTYRLEDTLTRIAHMPATVMRATIAPRGGAYLFCGSAIYADQSMGAFVIDTRPGGIVTLAADREAFRAAGCDVGVIILR